jgi:hypothetical protein
MRGPVLTLVLLIAIAVVAGGMALLVGVGRRPGEFEENGGRAATSGGGPAGPALGSPEDPRPAEGPAEPAAAPSDVPRERAIAGVVKDADGKPIALARVRALRQLPRQPQPEPVVATKTDGEGRYLLGPIEGRVLVEAGAEGWARSRKRGMPGGTVDFELGKPGGLGGRIAYTGGEEAGVRTPSSPSRAGASATGSPWRRAPTPAAPTRSRTCHRGATGSACCRRTVPASRSGRSRSPWARSSRRTSR